MTVHRHNRKNISGTPPVARPATTSRQKTAQCRSGISAAGPNLSRWIEAKGTRELLAELGCHAEIATKGVPAPIQNTARWVVERTNSWHNRGFKKLAICTEKRTRVIEAFIGLANAIITTGRLLRQGWTRYRWQGRPTRRP